MPDNAWYDLKLYTKGRLTATNELTSQRRIVQSYLMLVCGAKASNKDANYSILKIRKVHQEKQRLCTFRLFSYFVHNHCPFKMGNNYLG